MAGRRAIFYSANMHLCLRTHSVHLPECVCCDLQAQRFPECIAPQGFSLDIREPHTLDTETNYLGWGQGWGILCNEYIHIEEFKEKTNRGRTGALTEKYDDQ